MKERLIITEKSLIESTKHIAKEYDKEDVVEHIIEQVPETWTDLLELCAKYEELDTVNFILIKGVWFDEDGEVSIGEETIAENRTPAQMWAIIKSLVGEE